MFKDINLEKNKNLFVTATNTDVGKTYACEKILIKLANQGYKVGYFKPFETGVINNPLDGSAMLELTQVLNPEFLGVTINDVVPYQFKLAAAPYIAKGDISIDIEFLHEKKKYLEQFCDILIIEGAGGLLVPIDENLFIIDLIKAFEAYTLLVVPSNLGSINDNLLSQEALKNRGIEYTWLINLYRDKQSFGEVTLPFYKKYFKEIEFLDKI
ncbi:MAG: dethiobiotin synthase [Campylobacteraceae bacterium]|nr:dethiobiotin synthase [Campylobacteraceae bacterium]